MRRPRIETQAESQKLHKLLAHAGLGSRRLMETWIEAGRVTVNGKPAAIGARVTPRDHLQVDGRDVRIAAQEQTPRVLIYHKPDGEIVTRDDPQGRETVFERLPRLRGARWLAIGRLDVATSGLLLFTTSGELAHRLMHPRFAVEREYAVRVFGRLTDEHLAQLTRGVPLDDGDASCLNIADEGGEGSNHWYRVVMNEGRNRVVRRLFDAVGFTVSRLIRVRFGALQLPPRLKRGQFEELPPDQVKKLVAWLDRALTPQATPRENPRAPDALRTAKPVRS
ncbi:MAG: pseudouridine synthase [Betaproteobacteria bacterium]|nr:pseudouridine synthase [Betaproteobacteria bacterium]